MKIKLFEGGKLPQYSNPNDSGMDVFARETTQWYMKDGIWRCDVPLGFAIKCPREYGIFLLSRSGWGRDHSITLTNSVGLGDRSFGNNEYKAMLIKQAVTLVEPKPIEKHNKVAQIVMLHTEEITLDVVNDFTIDNQKTGFGSSGVK